jgi:hypothetical protein
MHPQYIKQQTGAATSLESNVDFGGLAAERFLFPKQQKSEVTCEACHNLNNPWYSQPV